MRNRLHARCLPLTCLWVIATASGAAASVGGTSHELLLDARVDGSASVLGASLMANAHGINHQLLVSSSASLSGIPQDATVQAAWLFWSGVVDPSVDDTASLTLPNGTLYAELALDACHTDEGACVLSANRCVTASSANLPVQFFACRRDVTGLLARLEGGAAAGTYSVGDVTAQVGVPDGTNPSQCDAQDPHCQSKYAAWSLVVVWTSPTATQSRRVVLMDGFRFFDEDAGGSGVDDPFTLTGFTVAPAGTAELTFMAMEGDATQGVPPQDAEPSQCPTCEDWMELQSSSHPQAWRVTDGTPDNPPGNLFNSTVLGGVSAEGLDLDRISVGDGSLETILVEGDTSLTVKVGSGDGAPGGDFGGGEFFLLGYVLLTVDENTPPDAGQPQPDAAVDIPDASVIDDGAIDIPDAAIDLDASVGDAAVQAPDAAVDIPDAAVVDAADAAVDIPDAAVEDAAVHVPDAAVDIPDAAVEDAAAHVPDGAVDILDAAVTADAGSNTSDAAVATDASVSTDAGKTTDASVVDSGRPDAAVVVADAGKTDAARPDSATIDAAVSDAAMADASGSDAAVAEAGPIVGPGGSATVSGGCVCASGPESLDGRWIGVMLGVVLCLVMRRKHRGP